MIAITVRDDFLLELGETVSGQASVRPVDSIATALEHLTDTKRAQVVVIDARDVADLPAQVARLQAETPAASILVFAPAEAEKQTATLLKGTTVFAVLPIPVEVRKTAAVFEGAVADATARRSAQQTSAKPEARGHDLRAGRGPAITVESLSSSSQPSQTEPASGGKMPLLIVAGVALLLLAGAAAWFFTRSAPEPQSADAGTSAPAEPASAEEIPDDKALLGPAPVADTSVVSGSLDELLEKARLAMRERRYTEPTGNNALVYYRSALAVDPTNPEALDGMSRVATVLAKRIDEALTEGNLDAAAQALANLKSASPQDTRIAALEQRLVTAQIEKSLADGNVDRAAALVRQAQQQKTLPADQLASWRAEITRRQEDARLRRLVDLFSDRVRAGRLTEPRNDSAEYYLAQIRETSPGNTTVQRLTRELNAAYLREAHEAGVAGRTSEMERWLAEARAGGVSASEIANLQREIAAARQRASAAEADRLVKLAQARLREGKLTEPAGDSAASYLTALRNADADNAALAPLSRELATKLIERASAAARERKTAQVQADLAAARQWGADSREIQAVEQLASSARPSPSGPRRPQIDPAELQKRLKRVRYVAPEYPPRALQQRIAGTVVVEFVVDTNGETRDVRVESADPAGVFDRAAINAVRRWRYEPVIIDNVPVEVPARTAIRFELPE